MTRKEITKLLTDTLINTRLSDRKYYAREVTLDYGTSDQKRVDVMQYSPEGVMYASDIERGEFTCYEVKSCKADLYSNHGLRFYGDRNYIVTTMDVWKNTIGPDLMQGTKLYDYVKDNYPESSTEFGVMVLIPYSIDTSDASRMMEEFKNPTPLSTDIRWTLWIAKPCRKCHRKRGTTELLFCMLRSKHNATNAG